MEKFLYGTGQGTGWYPPSWRSLRHFIRKLTEEQSPGLSFTAPNRKFLERTLDVFVDDVNGGLTMDGLRHFQSQSPTILPKNTEVREQTQSNMKFYSQLLFATGRKLTLRKFYVHLLRTIWKNGRRTFKKKHETMQPLRIAQVLWKEFHNINIIPPKEALTMIGITSTPTGSNILQYNKLLPKSQEWRNRVNKVIINA